MSSHIRPFEIRTEWDDGFRLVIDGVESRPRSFVAAADCARLSAASDNVFDRAYASEFDTMLVFDGQSFRVALRDAQETSSPLASLEEAAAWLDRTIRLTFPNSRYVTGDYYRFPDGTANGGGARSRERDRLVGVSSPVPDNKAAQPASLKVKNR